MAEADWERGLIEKLAGAALALLLIADAGLAVYLWQSGRQGPEEMRAERMSQQAAAHSRQQEKVAQLQRFIDRFKAKASKAKQAQSRVKALERMERLAPVHAAAGFSFEFREPLNAPNPLLVLVNVQPK